MVLRGFVYSPGMIAVDDNAFAGETRIGFVCSSGFSGLRRVIYVYCPAGLITNKWYF